eukprot:361392-Chlamydomonas_euryale.AAC.2
MTAVCVWCAVVALPRAAQYCGSPCEERLMTGWHWQPSAEGCFARQPCKSNADFTAVPGDGRQRVGRSSSSQLGRQAVAGP